MLVYEVWLDKIKASVMRYHVKGQEKDSHAVLPVDELVILQSTAPNAEAQAHSHFLRDNIPAMKISLQNWREIRAAKYLMIHKNPSTKMAK